MNTPEQSISPSSSTCSWEMVAEAKESMTVTAPYVGSNKKDMAELTMDLAAADLNGTDLPSPSSIPESPGIASMIGFEDVALLGDLPPPRGRSDSASRKPPEDPREAAKRRRKLEKKQKDAAKLNKAKEKRQAAIDEVRAEKEAKRAAKQAQKEQEEEDLDNRVIRIKMEVKRNYEEEARLEAKAARDNAKLERWAEMERPMTKDEMRHQYKQMKNSKPKGKTPDRSARQFADL
mmetsp:Transcript_11329/g.13388  ORF Transcript_11329/g.13388 Transcript_11329/m.13388 type:complete len:234 (+) Transcript_11329:280-981(+)|eukprot:CAMPEP_0197844260 /NCGR_PEP_ID=MMETSP1438-20131217/1251_1 /TAXON_ID=1461541 /ORGANISM="Pterosperma sp., Strain CCMP1384" /LENGTH=233 /DNA_ID=CAMNT_0043454963 /DNA_START=276 /DNA_END=977 /DNA_ORIENTATION=-